MSVALTITFDDLGVTSGLRRMQARADDLRPVLADIGAELESSTVKRFVTNVAPDGVPWPPSARAKEKPLTRTLVLTGDLRDSIHYVVESDAVEVGSALVYAGIHQVGGTITAKGKALAFTLFNGAFVMTKSVTIPARPYLGMSANDNATVLDIVGQHMARAAVGG
ncbi:phage virion morphogenesis protein [Caulobacter sp. SL161]|uniref:phage virion morphogenesis protein n=1 Tax=Caulobacter sp. SL161 TaxID=2995156 RepID=UPI0022769519|nr:phage virion morphogenesis protein [Caulobacter sp. SL161]MCY1648180.1 phage virion morphogenesis protein [Caulobacter sp. SL161]